jgi:colanic acid biosynthesis glycosyl transferase WcaI
MKILLLNQTFYPDNLATSQQVTDLAVFLVSQGHQVTTIAGKLGYEDKRKRFRNQEWYRGVRILRVGSLGLGKHNFLTRILEFLSFDICLLFKLIFVPAHDLVVSFTSPPLIGFFGMIFTFIKGGRSVQWLMDINPDGAIAVGYVKKGSLIARTLTAIFDLTLKHADKIVVLDRWMRKRIEAHSVPVEKIEIVPPWSVVNLQEAAQFDSPGVVEFKKKNDLENKTIILYSGNHSIVHPLETLLEAALKLRDDKNIVFVFMGAGARTLDVEAFKKKHQLENIRQLPLQPRESFHDALSAANIHMVVMGEAISGLVHTSKIYGVLASGRPYIVIGPKESHLNDLIDQCPYGYRVDHGDVSGLIETFQKIRTLPETELEGIRHANTQFVAGRFDAKISLNFFQEEIVLPYSDSAESA